MVTVACCQVPLRVGDRAGNAATLNDAVERAADAGARVIVLPELAPCGYMFADLAELRSVAETPDGESLQTWAALAREHDVIIVGGFAEDGSDGHVYNSAAIVDPSGVRTIYRKVHLWNREKDALFARGSSPPPVIETSVGRLGLMICYDVEFPEWVRQVALKGADLLCAPVNWPLYPRPDGERPADIVRVQAAAGTNRMAIACADRVGSERGQDWLGGSVIVDADGFPATAIRVGEPALLVADVDLAASRNKSVSELNDVHADRLPDLYV